MVETHYVYRLFIIVSLRIHKNGGMICDGYSFIENVLTVILFTQLLDRPTYRKDSYPSAQTNFAHEPSCVLHREGSKQRQAIIIKYNSMRFGV